MQNNPENIIKNRKNTIRKKWLTLLSVFIICSAGISTVIYTLQKSTVFYYTPHQFYDANIHRKTVPMTLRIGGIVKQDSVIRNNGKITFVLTDETAQMPILYSGILPSLFRQGQGIIAQGYYDIKTQKFIAVSLLAKHDENYMPPSVKNKNKTK